MIKLDDENFEKEVLKKTQPVLVSFWRPGCRACLVVDPIIQEVEKELKNRAIIGKVNIFENPEIAKKYKIPAVPTFIIFKKGEPAEKAIGLRSKQVLVEKINSLT